MWTGSKTGFSLSERISAQRIAAYSLKRGGFIMKKTKLLSAFLSLTLGMTSFAAVPVTASAAEIKPDAPVFANTVGTTTAAPQPITTTTVTTNEVEEGKFTAVINIYDEETGEAIPDINVQFIEYKSDWQTASDQPAEVVRVLAEWNTADTNQMVIENIDFVQGHFYAVKIDEFPEGYCYSWQDHIVTGIHGDGIFKGVKNYNLAVSHHKPFPTLEYPLDINREFTFSIVDMSTNEVVEGLDVELAQLDFDPEIVNKYNYSKTLDKWNTSDDPVHSITIPMHFDSENTSPYLWGIKINNMPEGYRYRLPDHDGYYVDGGYSVGDYKYDLYSEKNVTDYIYYILPK